MSCVCNTATISTHTTRSEFKEQFDHVPFSSPFVKATFTKPDLCDSLASLSDNVSLYEMSVVVSAVVVSS